MERLIELGASDDPIVAEYSTGALHNIQVCMARESLTRISVERYKNAAATAIQAVVCGFITRQRRRVRAQGSHRLTAATSEAQEEGSQQQQQKQEEEEEEMGAAINDSSGAAASGHAASLPKALRVSLRKSLNDDEERSQKTPRALQRALQRATTAAKTQSWASRAREQPAPNDPPPAARSESVV